MDTHSDWKAEFSSLFEVSVEKYKAGHQKPGGLFDSSASKFLQSIGYTEHEFFDFVEDFAKGGEPTLATALEIAEVRRDFFLNEQGGKRSEHEIDMATLPSKDAQMEGIGWLPRIIPKAQAKLRGEMPPDLMYACGGDRKFLGQTELLPLLFCAPCGKRRVSQLASLPGLRKTRASLASSAGWAWLVPLVLTARMMRRGILLAVLSFLGAAIPGAGHMLNITQARVSFDSSQQFKAEIDVDFSRAIGSPDAYYSLSLLPHDQQEAKIKALLGPLLDDMQFLFGDQIVRPELVNWTVPKASKETYTDYYVGKMTHLDLQGTLPPDRPPFVLNTLSQSTIEYPLALTVARPDHNIHVTRWLELQGLASDPFDYDQGAHTGKPYVAQKQVDPLSGANLTPFQRFWFVQFGALWQYLRLGFHHIWPSGLDHILFVLGLFFLGISWRKLVSQTTVFTIAHATTLYLSSRNIFSLPSWLVEPGIALSIMFIALENVFRPKLNAFRLVVVFGFGLIHGLGFAAGLKQLQLPQHEFIMALLGFNFGVDFGQLFIIALAFLVVGWFRNKPWYLGRIAVPASLLIATIGAVWTIERVWFYARLARA